MSIDTRVSHLLHWHRIYYHDEWARTPVLTECLQAVFASLCLLSLPWVQVLSLNFGKETECTLWGCSTWFVQSSWG